MKDLQKEERPKQEMPAELVSRLMGLIRGQFCGDMSGDEWGKHSHFIRRNVVLWPAHFICNVKGFTLPGARYEAIMREIFDGIKHHGTSAAVKYWPGYLMKCVQEHWRIHWEEYYAEAKAVRNIAQSAMVAFGRVTQEDRRVESLSMSRGVLEARHRARKTRPIASQQELL